MRLESTVKTLALELQVSACFQQDRMRVMDRSCESLLNARLVLGFGRGRLGYVHRGVRICTPTLVGWKHDKVQQMATSAVSIVGWAETHLGK